MTRSPAPAELRDRTVELFRILGHPDRLQVLLELDSAERLNVSELTRRCQSSQSAMSHQLRILRDAGIVRTERDGKRVIYLLSDNHVAHIIRDAVAHMAEC